MDQLQQDVEWGQQHNEQLQQQQQETESDDDEEEEDADDSLVMDSAMEKACMNGGVEDIVRQLDGGKNLTVLMSGGRLLSC